MSRHDVFPRVKETNITLNQTLGIGTMVRNLVDYLWQYHYSWGSVSMVSWKSTFGPTLHVRARRVTVPDLKNRRPEPERTSNRW